MVRVRSFGIAVVLGVAAADLASAQTTSVRFGGSEPTAELTPSQQRFADSLLLAIAGHDPSRYARLVHPASLACRNKDNEEVFADRVAWRQGIVTARKPYVTIQELPSQMKLFDHMAKNGYPTPVRPTHAIHVDLGRVGKTDRSLIAFVVSERGSWYEVDPCPTREAVAQFRANKVREAAERSKANELATSLRGPLRAEIIALLKEGQKVGAIKRYRDATGVDLAMANRVVEALESSTR
jgi:hypothetical protein